jgi:hypothetical protein
MPGQCDDVVRRFAEACQLGDIVALRATLDADATAVCDGSGLVPPGTGPFMARRTSPAWPRSCWAGNRVREVTRLAPRARPGLNPVFRPDWPVRAQDAPWLHPGQAGAGLAGDEAPFHRS